MSDTLAQRVNACLPRPCGAHSRIGLHRFYKALFTLEGKGLFHALLPEDNTEIHIARFVIAADLCKDLTDDRLDTNQCRPRGGALDLIERVQRLFEHSQVKMSRTIIQQQIGKIMVNPDGSIVINGLSKKSGMRVF